MPSERVQRRIDGLLDRAEEAVEVMDWPRALEAARAVLLDSIVGIWMKITMIEARFRLNQNRSAADRSMAAQRLDASGDQDAARIAALMRWHGEA